MPTYEVEHGGKKFRIDAADPNAAAEALGMHTGATPEQSSGALSRAFEAAIKPFTSWPAEYAKKRGEAVDQMGRGVDQLRNPDSVTDPKAHGISDILTGAGNVAMGGAGFIASPVNAAITTIAGKPIEENTGIPSELTDFAASMALPIPKRLPRLPKMGEATGPAKVAEGPLGVTLSEGQTTRDLSAIQREQAAARGATGDPAQQHAQAFFDQQRGEVAAARDKITTSMDPGGGQRIAESPQGAGEVVSQQLQRTAAQRKEGVTQAYDRAKAMGGEVEAQAFDGIGTRIKTDLSNRGEPIIIDDALTPFASRAIKDVDERINAMFIQNRADPRPHPGANEIAGINLEGVDQMRKRLSKFRQDAFGSGNATDGRAAKAVIDAFDDHIDAAINSGLFRGDKRAIDAWNSARAAHADYRRDFTASGKNDPIGRVVEKILGKGDNPAAIANDVADFMYGTAGVNPTSLNVGVVSRLKKTFGDKSPEWAGIKQGLWSRLVDAGEGATEFGAGKVAQRVNKFLNSDGKEMAAMMYSPAERDMLKSYADLMRKLEVPQAGANWSNTATFAAKALDKIGSNVGMTTAAMIGSALAHGAGMPLGVAEAAGGAIGAGVAKAGSMASNAMQARKIATQMPVIAKVMTDYKAAATAFETSPSARTVARLSIASRNLSTNLKDVGVNFSPDQLMRMLQGPRPGGAEQEQR